MNVLVKITIAFILGFTALPVNAQETFSITVKVENAENNKGQLFMALYNSESTFLNQTYAGKKSPIVNNGCEVIFTNIPQGVYAVSIFHDQNDNGKMDSNFMGIPKEDYGCSNNAKGFMGPPKWEDAKFELKAKNETITIIL